MAQDPRWKQKIGTFFNTCQDEIKKTTLIGRKMLSATISTTSLKESYEELGRLAYKDLQSGRLTWENGRAKQLKTEIERLTEDLEFIEKQVQEAKENSPDAPANEKSDLK